MQYTNARKKPIKGTLHYFEKSKTIARETFRLYYDPDYIDENVVFINVV